jgi:malyl-CoA/(S)-citramalyl-CoA lyase
MRPLFTLLARAQSATPLGRHVASRAVQDSGCRTANGLRPVDGPFGEFSDPEGYTATAKRAAALGYEGKWAIHPSQIELANQVMSPGSEEVDRARRILVAMKEAANQGKGAVSLDGRLIDYASIRQAEVLVEKANQIAAA